MSGLAISMTTRRPVSPKKPPRRTLPRSYGGARGRWPRESDTGSQAAGGHAAGWPAPIATSPVPRPSRCSTGSARTSARQWRRAAIRRHRPAIGSGRIGASWSSPSTRDTKRLPRPDLCAPPARIPSEGDQRIREFHGGMSDDAARGGAAGVQWTARRRTRFASSSAPTPRARASTSRATAQTSSTSTSRGTPPAWSSATAASIARCSPSDEVRCHYFFYPQRRRGSGAQDPGPQGRRHPGGAGLPRRGAERRDGARPRQQRADREVPRRDRASRAAARASCSGRAQCEAVRLDRARQRLRQQIDEAGRILERSHDKLGFRREHLRDAIDVALGLMQRSPLAPHPDIAGAFVLPEMPETWAPTLDVLRRPRGRDESFWDWRATPPLPVTFQPLDTITESVHHLHLEHPFVQRMLARFSSGHDLARVTVVRSRDDGLVRAIAFGRLSLFGAGAARLHEELVAVAAPWYEARNPRHLKPFASDADRKALDRLETTLEEPGAGRVPAAARKRLLTSAAGDFATLWPHVRDEADSLRAGRAQEARATRFARGRGAAPHPAPAEGVHRALSAQADAAVRDARCGSARAVGRGQEASEPAARGARSGARVRAARHRAVVRGGAATSGASGPDLSLARVEVAGIEVAGMAMGLGGRHGARDKVAGRPRGRRSRGTALRGGQTLPRAVAGHGPAHRGAGVRGPGPGGGTRGSAPSAAGSGAPSQSLSRWSSKTARAADIVSHRGTTTGRARCSGRISSIADRRCRMSCLCGCPRAGRSWSRHSRCGVATLCQMRARAEHRAPARSRMMAARRLSTRPRMTPRTRRSPTRPPRKVARVSHTLRWSGRSRTGSLSTSPRR